MYRTPDRETRGVILSDSDLNRLDRIKEFARDQGLTNGPMGVNLSIISCAGMLALEQLVADDPRKAARYIDLAQAEMRRESNRPGHLRVVERPATERSAIDTTIMLRLKTLHPEKTEDELALLITPKMREDYINETLRDRGVE